MRSMVVMRGARALLQTPDQGSDDGGSGNDLVSELGDDIRVVVDRWSVGQLGLAELLLTGGVLAVTSALVWLTRRIAHRYAARTTGAAAGAIQAAGQLVGAALILMALALTLEILGFSLGPVVMLVLIALVALLAIRPILTNLSTGLLLQIRGPFSIGDLIHTNNVVGVVQEISARTVVLQTGDGRRVHITNSDVLSGVIENYSVFEHRRSSLDVLLASDTDISLVSNVLQEAMGGLPEVLEDPAPEVRVTWFHGRYVAVAVLFWHKPGLGEQRRATDHVGRAILTGLAGAGIEMDGPNLMPFERD